MVRRSALLFLAGTEIAVLSLWSLTLDSETGLDALQYHREALAIAATGSAPWVLSPLSYFGLYPGSDNSAVPFLAASFSAVSSLPMVATVLFYDMLLLLLFGLGIFLLTRRFTDRTDLAILSIVLGSLAYGLSTAVSWSLDERSFNVALTPIFLLLAIPKQSGVGSRTSPAKYVVLGILCVVMLSAHLSFILLVPFLVLVPLLYEVVHRQFRARARRAASLAYFGAIALSPLLLLGALDQMGVLASSGLEYQLESSALFSGSSPAVFLLNSGVFLATRVGPVIMILSSLGLAYAATRRSLLSRNVLLGGFLLAGFVSLPIILYSKDLMTPILALLGSVGVGGGLGRLGARRATAVALVAVLAASGSVAFNTWNFDRTTRAADVTHWAPSSVTEETQNGNLWIDSRGPYSGCLFGNNAVALFEVATGARELVCNGVPTDYLINLGRETTSIHVGYAGVSSMNPSDWLSSPELTKMTQDFASIPFMKFAAAKNLLHAYNVSYIVIDMRKPDQVPLYGYQGTQYSTFFAELWDNLSPIYQSGTITVFQVH